MVTLGEFRFDNFSEESDIFSEATWVLFIGSTFIGQLTVLNMLIAIMGDSYDFVLENREQLALKEKIKLINDFAMIIPKQT